MKKMHHPSVFRRMALLICLIGIGVYGQKQTKTYNESFQVAKDAVIDINTSYADISFETWEKNEVVVEAVIELEGASTEEAKDYFEKGGVRILGNSGRIEISTGAEPSWSYVQGGAPVDVREFMIAPGFNELEPLFMDMDMPGFATVAPMPPMPPMPPVKMEHFDYDAYEKEGEKYLKKWKAEFNKNFNEDYKEQLSEWSELMKVRAEEWKADAEEHKQQRKELLRDRQEHMKERAAEREQAHKERSEDMKEWSKARVNERMLLDSSRIRVFQGDSLFAAPTIFFGSSGEGSRKYKIKKSIKIKMPKSATLKMNVRHGEVKLAENTRDMKANLSYARLLASTIDGANTDVVVSYSPMTVESWNNGQLNIQFSDKVALRDVKSLTLNATSSDVTIDRLLQSALIRNNLGAVHIKDVSKNFKDMDISMQNGELFCVLPVTAYKIFVKGTGSKLVSPSNLVFEVSKKDKTTMHKGYHLKENADKSIVINTQYSNVILQQ